MKKFLSVVLVVMMLASLSVCAFAAEGGSEEGSSSKENKVPSPPSDPIDVESAVIIGLEGYGEDDVIWQFIGVTSEPEDWYPEEPEGEFYEKRESLIALLETLKDSDVLAKALENAVTIETDSVRADDVYDTSEDAVPAVGDNCFFDLLDRKTFKSLLADEYVEGEVPAVKVQIIKKVIPENLIKVVQHVGEAWVEVPFVINDQGQTVMEVSYSGPIIFVLNANAENG